MTETLGSSPSGSTHSSHSWCQGSTAQRQSLLDISNWLGVSDGNPPSLSRKVVYSRQARIYKYRARPAVCLLHKRWIHPSRRWLIGSLLPVMTVSWIPILKQWDLLRIKNSMKLYWTINDTISPWRTTFVNVSRVGIPRDVPDDRVATSSNGGTLSMPLTFISVSLKAECCTWLKSSFDDVVVLNSNRLRRPLDLTVSWLAFQTTTHQKLKQQPLPQYIPKQSDRRKILLVCQ